MTLIGPAIVSGLIFAALYGLLASGIVLVYNTSRVINFAQGAIAMFCVFVLKTLLERGLPYVPAMLVAIAAGAAIGALVAWTTVVPMRRSSGLNRTIACVGWLIVLEAVAEMLFSANQATNIPPLFSQSELFSLLGLGVTAQEVAIVAATALVAGGLWLFFRRTYTGIAMRAASQQPEALELLGVSTKRVSYVAWALSGGLAALGGILVAPFLGALDDTTLTLFVIQCLGAALVGGLRNLPGTVVGALMLGLIQSLVATLPVSTEFPGLQFTAAFLFIVIVLALRPGLARQALDRSAEAGRRVMNYGRALVATKLGALGLLVLFLVLEGTVGGGSAGVFSDYNRYVWAQVFADAVIFLSLVLLTGMVGQISLCQVTFAGVGALLAAIFVTDWHLSFVFALPLAALCTAPIGLLIGLPALRVRGLQLAVITLSFALVGDDLLFAQSFPLSGGPAGRSITAVFGPLNLIGSASGAGDTSNRELYWVLLIILVLVGMSIWLLQRSPSGRALAAVRDSETAAAAVGVSIARMKLTAFAYSAAIAGLGGGMFAITLGQVSGLAFNTEFSIQYLALALLAGVRSVWGALAASVFLVWGSTVIAAGLAWLHLDPNIAPEVQLLLSGTLLVITMRFNPRGVIGGFEDLAGGAIRLVGSGMSSSRHRIAQPHRVA